MKSGNPILFYDGYCGLCSWSVQFVLRHENKKDILFTPLQSGFAQNFLTKYGIDLKNNNSVVFYEKNKIYTKSKAVFKITKHLKYPYRLLSVFKILPKFVTDAFYNAMAKSRYIFWTRNSSCYVNNNINRFI